ncbi:hypothetical protein GGS26DRAFT_325885 [Hypomontagnella submonticulosa]|nr:hypothetical protein GGS26DRAFT_325885 [Hypomontagnella submonticulosa]
MSTTTGEAVGSSKGFVSHAEEVPEARSVVDSDSLFDYIPFEDIGTPRINRTPVATETADIAVPTNPITISTIRSRLRSFPSFYRVIDWFMGRHVMTCEDNRSVKWLSEACNVSKGSSRDDREGPGVQRMVADDFIDIGDVHDTCPACTTPYCQAIDSLPFKSSLKLGYNDPETHTWLIGDKYVMNEATDSESPEYTDVTLALAAEFLRRSTRVPIPNVIAGWKENGKVITIAERAPGQRLYDIWWDLQTSERERIAKEVARHMDQWRRLTSDRISSLGGGPVWHHDHLFGTLGEGFGPFSSDEEVWAAIYHRLERNDVDESVINILKDYMPESAPCVFTHGDLSCANILIHNGKVSAILGFESAACLPVWAEHVAVHFCSCAEDEQWKAMLSRHIKSYARAKDWWSLWRAVETDPSDVKRIVAFAARLRRWQRPPQQKRPFDIEEPDVGRAPQDEQDQDQSYQILMPEPRPGSPRRKGVEVQKGRSPYRTALSRKLLKGRHYSKLLGDPLWESPVHSHSEDSEVGEVIDEEEHVLEIEKELEIPGTQMQADVDVDVERPDEERSEDSSEKAKRIRIERWISDHERGRKALPYPLRMSGEKGDSLVSPVKEHPPWRERQRSFERRDNESKGLRPFSLPLSHLSESIKQNLREVGETIEEDDDDGGDGREGALRRLESGHEDLEPATAAEATTSAPQVDVEQTRDSLPAEKKRLSIFRERNSPGSLYLAVANAAAEGKGRRHRRSRSED